MTITERKALIVGPDGFLELRSLFEVGGQIYVHPDDAQQGRTVELGSLTVTLNGWGLPDGTVGQVITLPDTGTRGLLIVG